MSPGTERAQDVVYPFPLGRIRLKERSEMYALYLVSRECINL